jgi:hypothetical protein
MSIRRFRQRLIFRIRGKGWASADGRVGMNSSESSALDAGLVGHEGTHLGTGGIFTEFFTMHGEHECLGAAVTGARGASSKYPFSSITYHRAHSGDTW